MLDSNNFANSPIAYVDHAENCFFFRTKRFLKNDFKHTTTCFFWKILCFI